MTSRLGWWALLVLSGCWTMSWSLSAFLAWEAPDRCQKHPEVVRGAYHLHATGHDGRDRSEALLKAADEACLDFLVVTDHGGLQSQIVNADATIEIMDGAEWTVDNGHHHGQLVGVHEGVASSFRVLNHPTWSGIEGLLDLSTEEREMLERGQLGMEILNGVRLWRTPPSWSARIPALLLGPGALDQAQIALSLPGPDVALWDAWQHELGRSIPMICGSDAHGDFTRHRDSLTIWSLHIRRGLDVVEGLKNGEVVCVNELMGAPGIVRLETTERPCELRVRANLEAGEWRVIASGEAIARGDSSQVIAVHRPGFYHVQVWRSWRLGWLGERERLWVITQALEIPEACGS